MAKTLLLLAALSLAFGWWGNYTVAGRQRFDEMAGILPLAALALGGILAAAGLLILFLRR